MPKGAKKRKAAKKKQERKANLNNSGSNSLAGNDELRSQDEKESDGGEVSSPASQDHNNPFVEGEGEDEEEKRDTSPDQSFVSEEKITEETIIDADGTYKAGIEDEGVVQIDWKIKSEDDIEIRDVNVEDKKFLNGARDGGSSHDGGSSSSRSSSNNNDSDDETLVIEKNLFVVETEEPNEEVSNSVVVESEVYNSVVAESEVSNLVVAKLEESKEDFANLVMEESEEPKEEASDLVLAESEEPKKEVSNLLAESEDPTKEVSDLVVVELEEPKEEVSNLGVVELEEPKEEVSDLVVVESEEPNEEVSNLVVESEEPNEEVSNLDLEATNVDDSVTQDVLPSDEVVGTHGDDVSKQVIYIPEEVIHAIPTVLVENTVAFDLVEFESKENREKILPSLDEGTEVSSRVTLDLELEKKEDKVFPLLDEKEDEILPSSDPNVEVSLVVLDLESEKKVDKVAIVDETSNGAEHITVSKVLECSENQPVVALAPRMVQRTSPWWSCCGLFDLATSSDR